VDAIVLGCAGMAELCDWLSLEIGVPVIDGVTAAVKLAEAMAGGGFRTSKAGAYAYPRDKSGDIARAQ
jgi:allantoin racemase